MLILHLAIDFHQAVVEEFTKITMTREVAKAFAHVMMHNIAKHEPQFGEISMTNVLKIEGLPEEQMNPKGE